MYKKETLKLKKVNNKAVIQGVKSSELLKAPKFDKIILESGNQTSRQNNEAVQDTIVTLKMSLEVGEVTSASEGFENHIKIVIMQSNTGSKLESSKKIYENFIKDTSLYKKEGDTMFFEISTILEEKISSELSFCAFVYFDLASLTVSTDSDSGFYVGDIVK